MSSGRLVQGAKAAAGQRQGRSGQKSGTPQLQGAVSEAAGRFLRPHQPGQAYCATVERKHGQGKALTGLAPKLARAGYSMLTRHQAFALPRLVTASPLRGTREPAGSLVSQGVEPLDAHIMCGPDRERASGH